MSHHHRKHAYVGKLQRAEFASELLPVDLQSSQFDTAAQDANALCELVAVHITSPTANSTCC